MNVLKSQLYTQIDPTIQSPPKQKAVNWTRDSLKDWLTPNDSIIDSLL